MTAPRATSDQAYVLHSRPFRETSVLLDILTPEHGRLSGIMRGIRAAKRGNNPRPFVRYSATWAGRGEVLNLSKLETLSAYHFADMRRMLCALYMNELIVKLTTRANPSNTLFKLYDGALQTLRAGQVADAVLREFEAELLDALGYGVHLDDRDSSGAAIDPNDTYLYDLDSGGVHRCRSDSTQGAISGKALWGIKHGQYTDAGIARELKHFFRRILDHHLQGREIYARKILQQIV